MKVLLHTDAYGVKPYGIWWVGEVSGYPESLYTNPLSPEAARGRALVLSKENPKVSWPEWFDQLTTRAPYSENWQVFESNGLTPETMLLNF